MALWSTYPSLDARALCRSPHVRSSTRRLTSTNPNSSTHWSLPLRIDDGKKFQRLAWMELCLFLYIEHHVRCIVCHDGTPSPSSYIHSDKFIQPELFPTKDRGTGTGLAGQFHLIGQDVNSYLSSHCQSYFRRNVATYCPQGRLEHTSTDLHIWSALPCCGSHRLAITV